MQIDQCLETLQELLTERRWSLKNNTIGVIPNPLTVEDINIDIDTLQNAIHLIECEIENRNDIETLLKDGLKNHFKKCELAVLHFSAKDLVDLSGDLSMMDIKNIVEKNWRMPRSKPVHFYDLWCFVNKKRRAVHPRPKARIYQFFASQFFSVPELISFLDPDNLVELEKKQRKARKPSWFELFKYDDFLQAMTKEKPTENSMAQKMILVLEMLPKRKKTTEKFLKYLVSSSESFEQFIGIFQALFEAKEKEL